MTHLLGGWLFCMCAQPLIAASAGRPAWRRALWVYLFGVSSMFFASSSYHMLPLGSEWRGVFWYLDHGAIWLCIASTITCVHVIACKPRRAYLIAVWVAALGGACLELIWLSRLPPWVSPLAYVAMGWLGTFPLLELWRRHGKGAAAPILSGGVIYTLGGAADALEWPNFGPNLGSHETLHVMVLGGTAFFWLVVHQAMLREAEVLQEEG